MQRLLASSVRAVTGPHDRGPPIDVNTEDNQENQTMQSDATEEADATEAGESETPVSVCSATTMSSPQGHEAFLFICLPGPSLLVPCSISIHLQVCHWWCPPLSVGHEAFLFVWCPPFSVGHVAFLSICLRGLSLLVSALFRRQCSFPSAMQHFYSLVSQVCHCATFLFMRFPGLLLMSALFRWPCSISIHSPNSLLSGVLNALKNGRLGAGWSGRVPQFFSFVSQFFSCVWVLVVGFRLVRFPAGLSPTSLHVSPIFSRFFCLPCLSLLISALFRWPCSISIHVPGLSLLVPALVRWPCSISILLSCRSVTGVSLCIGHEAFLFICLRSVTAGAM